MPDGLKLGEKDGDGFGFVEGAVDGILLGETFG